MENKTEFLEKLIALFLLHGAKTLTMDDIAKEFSVSKKTLYQHYNNKEALLIDALNHVTDKVITEIKKINKNSHCAIEIMFLRNQVINEMVDPEKNAFVLQLIKYYPEVYHHHIINVHSKVSELLNENYLYGKEIGVYREDIPYELYGKFFMTLNFSLETSPLFSEDNKEEKQQVCKQALRFYLDAILSNKGKQRLKELNKKYEEFN